VESPTREESAAVIFIMFTSLSHYCIFLSGSALLHSFTLLVDPYNLCLSIDPYWQGVSVHAYGPRWRLPSIASLVISCRHSTPKPLSRTEGGGGRVKTTFSSVGVPPGDQPPRAQWVGACSPHRPSEVDARYEETFPFPTIEPRFFGRPFRPELSTH
jgi:hypothetical protein